MTQKSLHELLLQLQSNGYAGSLEIPDDFGLESESGQRLLGAAMRLVSEPQTLAFIDQNIRRVVFNRDALSLLECKNLSALLQELSDFKILTVYEDLLQDMKSELPKLKEQINACEQEQAALAEALDGLNLESTEQKELIAALRLLQPELVAQDESEHQARVQTLKTQLDESRENAQALSAQVDDCVERLKTLPQVQALKKIESPEMQAALAKVAKVLLSQSTNQGLLTQKRTIIRQALEKMDLPKATELLTLLNGLGLLAKEDSEQLKTAEDQGFLNFVRTQNLMKDLKNNNKIPSETEFNVALAEKGEEYKKSLEKESAGALVHVAEMALVNQFLGSFDSNALAAQAMVNGYDDLSDKMRTFKEFFDTRGEELEKVLSH